MSYGSCSTPLSLSIPCFGLYGPTCPITKNIQRNKSTPETQLNIMPVVNETPMDNTDQQSRKQ